MNFQETLRAEFTEQELDLKKLMINLTHRHGKRHPWSKLIRTTYAKGWILQTQLHQILSLLQEPLLEAVPPRCAKEAGLDVVFCVIQAMIDLIHNYDYADSELNQLLDQVALGWCCGKGQISAAATTTAHPIATRMQPSSA